MKKNKIKKFIKLHMVLFLISFFMVWTVLGSFTSYVITSQYSDLTWSNGSNISFTWSTWKEWYYVNNRDNSAIIWNYFTWFYYDSLFWFFKLDWSPNEYDNVRIIDSTNKCSTWYWYKLWWKAYSEISWYIDFAYDDDTFVYYCLDTGELHGKAYWKYIWYQNFEWIELTIIKEVEDLTVTATATGVFINDVTTVNKSRALEPDLIPTYWWEINIWWNIYQIDTTKESIFYIIK